MPAEYSVRMTGQGPQSDAPSHRLLLASRSPRRRMLLDEHGLSHDAEHPGFEDSVLERGSVSPEQWVASLAYLKAWAKASEPGGSGRGRLIIGADTACLLDGRLIGTPRDAVEAEAMIRSFMDAEHDVLTGVAIIDIRSPSASVRRFFVDRARVRMGRLSEDQLAQYIAGGGWAGKAGAYNYRDAVESGWPISHTGDATTIMGLPMKALLRTLGTLGVVREEPIVTTPSNSSASGSASGSASASTGAVA